MVRYSEMRVFLEVDANMKKIVIFCIGIPEICSGLFLMTWLA